MKKKKFLFFFIICLTIGTFSLQAKNNFLVYYSDEASADKIKNYPVCVLDTYNHPNLDLINESGTVTLGYLSVGEIENIRPYFKKFKKAGLLIKENKNWPGSHFVDIRNPKWPSYVIQTLIPYILQKGFKGVFIDTLDNPIALQNQNPKKYKRMKRSAIHLIKAIRKNFPKIKIMVNRAYDILPEIADSIDMVLGESVYTDYDFEDKEYNFVNKKAYQYQVKTLRKLKRQHPHLKIFTLDYWNKDDKKTIKKIYKVQRNNGFIPYVSTIKLDKIIKEPDNGNAE